MDTSSSILIFCRVVFSITIEDVAIVGIIITKTTNTVKREIIVTF